MTDALWPTSREEDDEPTTEELKLVLEGVRRDVATARPAYLPPIKRCPECGDPFGSGDNCGHCGF